MAAYPPAGGGGLGATPSVPGARPAGEGIGGSPPGLWQPPGFTPAATGATGQASAPAGRELELQKEISGTIEAQVQRLIEQARHDTESKVKLELKQIRDLMLAMDARLDSLLVQLDGMQPQEPQEPLEAEVVGQLLSNVEQKWGAEIRTLKQELHQTILAHNHNADLIKHHKDTIDALRDRCNKLQNSSARTSEIQQQLNRLDARLKQQQKQRKLEPLFERLTALEQRVAAAVSTSWRGYPGMSPVVPTGMGSLPPGISAAMMPGIGAVPGGLHGGKGGAQKAAGVPGGVGAALGAKAGEKAAYKRPTEEEVKAQLSKLSTGAEAEGQA